MTPSDTLSSSADDVPSVVLGTHGDAAEICRWLKAEFDVDQDGFWHNRNIIADAVQNEELWVIREEDHAVAFQVGTYAPDILNVRKDRQGRGLGSALFAAALARARADDVVVLNITCMPRSSLAFWQKQGFEPVGSISEWGEIPARRVLGRTFELPVGIETVVAKIEFYAEGALYDDAIAPFETQTVSGVMGPDGALALERRVIGASPDAHDLAIRISVAGRQLCFCKAKYDEAKAIGVQRARGAAFFVDVIKTGTTID
ncbi:GNAT family N-acetyltransferase [Brevundimonas vesicularis]|uniref:GNAT family N-acetyltransferase n=1 Tax=Brevundimonas vesicularis TaxID=41276 RepID=UPI0030BB4899